MALQYQSSLTGPEIDAALEDMAAHNSEAWAVGERDGVAVGVSDITYHNNAAYYANQASGAAARAEAAVPSGTAGAVFFDRSQTLTEAQQMQARANIKAGGSNPNLLLNPWFTVNQRGRTSMSGNGMFVDGWRVTYGTAVRTVNSDGTVTIGHGYEGNMTNRIDLPIDALAGKTATVSVMLADGTIGSWTRTVPAATSSNQKVFEAGFQGHTITFYIAANTAAYSYYVNLYTGPNSTRDITLRAFKLEVGSVSTLANDAPPDYASELAKCQRYYMRFKGAQYLSLGFALAESASQAYAAIQLPVPMRVRPTVATNGTLTLWGGSTSNAHTVTSLAANDSGTPATDCSYVKVRANSSGLTIGGIYELDFRNDTTAYLELSADL